MVSREQKVSQSVEEYLKAKLTGAGYGDDNVEVLDAWDGDDLPTPLTKNFVATGYSFDNGGAPAEMGSDLITRLYTIEFFIFARNMTWGRNLASVIQTAIEDDGLIPLLDIGEPGQPQIDALALDNVAAQREATGLNPPEWQKFVWTVRARVVDEYYANLT